MEFAGPCGEKPPEFASELMTPATQMRARGSLDATTPFNIRIQPILAFAFVPPRHPNTAIYADYT